LLHSIGVAAVSEIGDKTQLLSLLLAARFRRPWPIIAGIRVATLLNHGLTAWGGERVAMWLGPQPTRWLLGMPFIATAVWALKPDEIGSGTMDHRRFGVFVATLSAFSSPRWATILGLRLSH
jgi:putative Ca2+/H+ antiporter (TMEM165/GDT1 family)